MSFSIEAIRSARDQLADAHFHGRNGTLRNGLRGDLPLAKGKTDKVARNHFVKLPGPSGILCFD